MFFCLFRFCVFLFVFLFPFLGQASQGPLLDLEAQTASIEFTSEEEMLFTHKDKLLVRNINVYSPRHFQETKNPSSSRRCCHRFQTVVRVGAVLVATLGVLGGLTILQNIIVGEPYNWNTVVGAVIGLVSIAFTVSTQAFTMPIESWLTKLTFQAMVPADGQVAVPSSYKENWWFYLQRFSFNWRETRDTVAYSLFYLNGLDESLARALEHARSQDKEDIVVAFVVERLVMEIIQTFPDVMGSPDFLQALHSRMARTLTQFDMRLSEELAQRIGSTALRRMLFLARKQKKAGREVRHFPEANLLSVCQFARCFGPAEKDPELSHIFAF